MRYLASSLCTLVLGAGVLFGIAGTASATAQSAMAKQDTVTAGQCVGGGGFVDQDGTSPTGLRCLGGQFDGIPVTLGQ
ncbi:hypothetical protein ACH427_23565 [Streptomyces sp. NPDC020379]|uniref:hypothetical protein n=1 Tax=Streptomyces sp. NPDC020379 TaxID=3365071 RepID=UPI00378891B6